jgi:hypothetical protein
MMVVVMNTTTSMIEVRMTVISRTCAARLTGNTGLLVLFDAIEERRHEARLSLKLLQGACSA